MLSITRHQSGKCSDQHMEDAVTGGRPDATEWRHSRACNGGARVEVASMGQLIGVRDSEDPGSILTVSAGSWRDFVAGVKNGEFGNDLLPQP